MASPDSLYSYTICSGCCKASKSLRLINWWGSREDWNRSGTLARSIGRTNSENKHISIRPVRYIASDYRPIVSFVTSGGDRIWDFYRHNFQFGNPCNSSNILGMPRMMTVPRSLNVWISDFTFEPMRTDKSSSLYLAVFLQSGRGWKTLPHSPLASSPSYYRSMDLLEMLTVSL